MWRSITGGILADPAGHGKSLSLLALIMTVRKNNRQAAAPVNRENRMDDDLLEKVFKKLLPSLEAKPILMEIKRKLIFNIEPSSLAVRDRIICNCGYCCNRSQIRWRSSTEKFICPECLQKNAIKYESGATLIVVPQYLLFQWHAEILKHIKEPIKIDLYLGLEVDGYKHPLYLSQCDIVLTSYETLKAEHSYIRPSMVLNMRKRKNISQSYATSPLLNVDRWRICLDEANQMRNDVVTEFTHLLKGRARWCIVRDPFDAELFLAMMHFFNVSPLDLPGAYEALLHNISNDRRGTDLRF